MNEDLTNRRPYRLVSADQHINEPPDLWTSRVAKKFRDRVPRIEHFEQGDAWVFEGALEPINFGLNSCAGRPHENQKAWCRWEEVRPGGYDPASRLSEMDADHVDAALNFPTPRVATGITSNKDPELHLLMVQAYNDWLSDYCAHAPDRLFGLALLPNRGIDMALDEYERVIERPGIAGITINCYPHGDTTLRKDDDPLWAVIEQSGRPLTLHVGLHDTPPTAHAPGIVGELRIVEPARRMLEFMWAGVLDRFPRLRVVFTEVDCGWVPYFREQTDNRFVRMATAARFGLERVPSEYFDDHYAYTYVTDTVGIDNRHSIGVKNIMWSDDFPHLGADWPNSQRTISASFTGVPRAEREAILAGNCARIYKLPGLIAKS